MLGKSTLSRSEFEYLILDILAAADVPQRLYIDPEVWGIGISGLHAIYNHLTDCGVRAVYGVPFVVPGGEVLITIQMHLGKMVVNIELTYTQPDARMFKYIPRKNAT